jgi:hypothetical protein
MVLPLVLALPLTFLISLPACLLAAFLLVTVVESIVLCSVLGVSIWYCAWEVFVANLVSTAFGIFGMPIALVIIWISLFWWFLSFISNIEFLLVIVTVQLTWAAFRETFSSDSGRMYDAWWKRLLVVTLFAPFLLGGDDDGGEDWMVPAAMLTCLIPYFFASWYIESFVANTIVRPHGFSPELVKSGLLVGNLVTYGAIALLVAVWLIMELLGITWDDLLRAKRKFVAKLYGYKTISETLSRSRISKAYEPGRGGVHRDLDVPAGAKARVDKKLKTSSERQFQIQGKAKNESEVTANSKEVTKAA